MSSASGSAAAAVPGSALPSVEPAQKRTHASALCTTTKTYALARTGNCWLAESRHPGWAAPLRPAARGAAACTCRRGCWPSRSRRRCPPSARSDSDSARRRSTKTAFGGDCAKHCVNQDSVRCRRRCAKRCVPRWFVVPRSNVAHNVAHNVAQRTTFGALTRVLSHMFSAWSTAVIFPMPLSTTFSMLPHVWSLPQQAIVSC